MHRSNHLILPLVVALLAPWSVAIAQTTALEQRVGVQRRVTLTLRDAVTMALENNRDIQIERLNVQMNEFELKAARGRELKALTDYHKAVSELQRTLATTLTNNSVTIASR